MTAKRLGGVLRNSKVSVIGAAVAGELSDVSRQLETPLDRNRGAFERVPLDGVAPDPNNPRNLKLTFEELQQGVGQLQQGITEATTKRQRVYESIAELAATLKEVGQLHPVTAYRDERGRLRIIDGERRYWGARLLGWTHIDAKVKPQRPEYIRLEQYVANVQREDLTLGQHLNNLQMLLKEAEEQGREVSSINDLATLIHRSRTTVQRWWSVLRGPADVREAMLADKVQSLDRAYTASQERDPGRREALLTGQVIPARNTQRAESFGRPKVKVSLGATNDVQAIRTLMRALPLGQKFEDVNWGDLTAVQKVWQKFLKALEAEVKKGGAGEKLE